MQKRKGICEFDFGASYIQNKHPLTCIMRMSNRPTKRVTETMRSNAVLNKSADVLYKLKLRMSDVFCWSHLESNLVWLTCRSRRPYPEYQGTMSRKSGFICFFSFSSSSSVDGWVSAHLKYLQNITTQILTIQRKEFKVLEMNISSLHVTTVNSAIIVRRV